MKNIFNIIGFQVSWWGCVLGVKSGMTYLGPFLMLCFLTVHIILFGIIGTMIDTSMAYSEILIYNGKYTPSTLFAPLWITSMWCGFSATINHSLQWLRHRYFASVLLGVVSGPLSYLAGIKFGAIEFNAAPIIALLIIAIFYGLTIPIMYWVNEKLVLNR